MAIKKLIEAGKAKYVISQNVDGLHRRSGLPPKFLAELHGNTNLEQCETCGKDYLRDYHVRNNGHVHQHWTGNLCSCGGKLKDTIINFGENLPEKELQDSFDHSGKADACIVLGSSLTVTPAASCPKIVAKNGGKLVICNLQRTPLDGRATTRVHAYCDVLMQRVMEKLALEIPPFLLHRRLSLKTTVRPKSESTKRFRVVVRGVEDDGTPASIFKSVVFSSKSHKEKTACAAEPYQLTDTVEQIGTLAVKICLEFYGHYLEPSLSFKHKIELDVKAKQSTTKFIDLLYDPRTREWQTVEVAS